MRVIESTGNAEQDAKLVEEALGHVQPTLEEAKAKEKKANEDCAKETKNAFVDQPRLKGQALLVLPDDEEEPKAAAPQAAAPKAQEEASPEEPKRRFNLN